MNHVTKSWFAIRNLRLTIPALAFLAVFFVVPLVSNATLGFHVPGEGWSLDLYRRFLTDPFYLKILADTIKVSLLTTVICIVVGYPIAFYLVRRAKRSRGAILFLLLAPLLTSVIMRTFGWEVFFARNGLINAALYNMGLISRKVDLLRNPVSVYFGLVHVLVTYMVLSISSVLQSIDVRLEESAQVLGASRWRTFLKITLPLSLDGVMTGCVLVFMLTNGSFLSMLLLGGGTVVTLPLLIYQQFTVSQDIALASTMSNVLMAVAVGVMVLQLAFMKRRGV